MSHKPLTDEEVQIIRDHAMDPRKSKASMVRSLPGRSRKSIDWMLEQAGVKWQGTSADTHRRVFTEEEKQIVREFAVDPNKSQMDLRSELNTNCTLINELVEELGVTWLTGKEARNTLDAAALDKFRRICADRSVSIDNAALRMGVSTYRIKQWMTLYKVQWVCASDRECRPRRSDPGIPTKRTSRPVENTRKKPAPKIKTPEFQVEPQSFRGLNGFRWHCPALSLTGWKAGDREEAVVADVHREIALHEHRRTEI